MKTPFQAKQSLENILAPLLNNDTPEIVWEQGCFYNDGDVDSYFEVRLSSPLEEYSRKEFESIHSSLFASAFGDFDLKRITFSKGSTSYTFKESSCSI